MDQKVGAEVMGAKNAAERSQQLDPITVSGDRLRKKVPWILRDERYVNESLNADLEKLNEQDDFEMADIEALEEANKARFSTRWYNDALTESQVAAIAMRFSFSPNDVKQLSRRLARALNPEEEPVTLTLSREKASASAKDKLARAKEHMMDASEEAVKSLKLVEGLSTQMARDRVTADRFEQAVKDHVAMLLEIERIYYLYEYFASVDDLALDKDVVNKSSARDLRRQIVLAVLFDFWAERGRNLSVTTDPIEKSRRKGPLVDFVNMAVRALTDPPTELPGETIWKDLKGFKSSRPKD